MATPDPIAAIETVLKANASYLSDDSTPITENYANNGLDVQTFPYGRNKQRLIPLLEVGPLSDTIVKPESIGNTPNSRWLYQYLIELHAFTQTFSSPNVTGYDAMTGLAESIRQIIVQNQSTVDGSGNWLLLEISSGPKFGPETAVTPDRFELVWILKLWRSQVD